MWLRASGLGFRGCSLGSQVVHGLPDMEASPLVRVLFVANCFLLRSQRRTGVRHK